MHRFRATIEQGTFAANSWCFVRVPDDIRRDLKNSRRVTGTIASEPFDGSLHSRNGTQRVLVKRELRDRLGLEPGQEIDVTIEADSRIRSVDLPPELVAALASRPDVATIFDRLAPSHRRELADWVAQAKKAATRQIRAERALEMIAAKRHRT